MEQKKEKSNSAFLLKLKQALETGKANETTSIINNIDEHSKSLTAEDALDRLTARIEEVGYAKSVSEEERLKTQAEYEVEMEKVRQEESKLMSIANIENAKTEIVATKNELADVIQEITKKYTLLIEKQRVDLRELEEKFKEKYGKEAFETNFGSGNTKII